MAQRYISARLVARGYSPDLDTYRQNLARQYNTDPRYPNITVPVEQWDALQRELQKQGGYSVLSTAGYEGTPSATARAIIGGRDIRSSQITTTPTQPQQEKFRIQRVLTEQEKAALRTPIAKLPGTTSLQKIRTQPLNPFRIQRVLTEQEKADLRTPIKGLVQTIPKLPGLLELPPPIIDTSQIPQTPPAQAFNFITGILSKKEKQAGIIENVEKIESKTYNILDYLIPEKQDEKLITKIPKWAAKSVVTIPLSLGFKVAGLTVAPATTIEKTQEEIKQIPTYVKSDPLKAGVEVGSALLFSLGLSKLGTKPPPVKTLALQTKLAEQTRQTTPTGKLLKSQYALKGQAKVQIKPPLSSIKTIDYDIGGVAKRLAIKSIKINKPTPKGVPVVLKVKTGPKSFANIQAIVPEEKLGSVINIGASKEPTLGVNVYKISSQSGKPAYGVTYDITKLNKAGDLAQSVNVGKVILPKGKTLDIFGKDIAQKVSEITRTTDVIKPSGITPRGVYSYWESVGYGKDSSGVFPQVGRSEVRTLLQKTDSSFVDVVSKKGVKTSKITGFETPSAGIQKSIEKLAAEQSKPKPLALVPIKTVKTTKQKTEEKTIDVIPQPPIQDIESSLVQIKRPKQTTTQISSDITALDKLTQSENIIIPAIKSLEKTKTIQQPLSAQTPLVESVEAQKTKTLQKAAQKSAAKQKTIQKIQQLVSLKSTVSPLKISTLGTSSDEPITPKVSKTNGKKVPGFEVLIKRFGKFQKVGGPVPKSVAIRKGEKIVKETLAATFKIIPAKKLVASKNGKKYLPDPKQFREYKKKKGAKIAQEFTWIERRKYRLSTPGEKKSIQRSKKKKGKGGGMIKWM